MIKQPQQIHLKQMLSQPHNDNLESKHLAHKSFQSQASHILLTDRFLASPLSAPTSQPQEISFKDSSGAVSFIRTHPYVTYISSPKLNKVEHPFQEQQQIKTRTSVKLPQQIKIHPSVNLQQQYLFNSKINIEESKSFSATSQAENPSFVRDTDEQNLDNETTSNFFRSPLKVKSGDLVYSVEKASCKNIKTEWRNRDRENINENKKFSPVNDQFNANFEISKLKQVKEDPLDVISSDVKGIVLDSKLCFQHTNSSDIKDFSKLQENVKLVKKTFKPDELRHALMPTLRKLFEQHPESRDFWHPVDPDLLRIPDYFDIVKNPIDLSTIKQKLDIGQYQDPWQYVEDVWLMFDNAWLYNKRTSRVYRNCSKLAEIFAQEIDPVMRTLGFCCGRKYVFQSQVLYCYSKQCIIAKGDSYWSYQDRYIYCQKCFMDVHDETIILRDDFMQNSMSIKKENFVALKNYHTVPEPFVECNDCGRKFHQICVLHLEFIWPDGFICNNCVKKKGEERKWNKFTSRRLQHSKLGQFVENRVHNFLKRKGISNKVFIRVVSSSEKFVEVKPGMKARYVDTGIWPERFPYKEKALFAFEEIDGADVCFFGMHVQEYGSDCALPNRRHVYVAYLDSVHFFQPKQYRTAVYHEIVLGYLDYVKQLGFTTAYVWACPPKEGEDFIFHCHSSEQRFPTVKRLQKWYKEMFDKGVLEGIILDYKNILQSAVEYNFESASELPYFDGDFWPNVLEDSIKELYAENEISEILPAETIDVNSNEIMKKANKIAVSKVSATNKNHSRKKRRLNSSYVVGDLCAKIYSAMKRYKEIFFVIRLHSAQKIETLPQIVDPDPSIISELMNGRDAFLSMCRENHYEFSSLRRAKFSTLALLYELHIQGQVICNSCKKNIESRYHCLTCDDFDLCIDCFGKEGHNHKMEKINFILEHSPELLNQRQMCFKYHASKYDLPLLHASQCMDYNCQFSACREMKGYLIHIKHCKKKKTRTSCVLCKRFFLLCYYHASHCQVVKCPLQFCYKMKQKFHKQTVGCPVVTKNEKGCCISPQTSTPNFVSSEEKCVTAGKSSDDFLNSSFKSAKQIEMPTVPTSNPITFQKSQEKAVAPVSECIISMLEKSNMIVTERDSCKAKISYKKNPQLQPNGVSINPQSSTTRPVIPQAIMKLVEILKTSPSVQQRKKALSILTSYSNARSAFSKVKLLQQRYSSKPKVQNKYEEIPVLQSCTNSQFACTQSPENSEFHSCGKNNVQQQPQQILITSEVKQMTSPNRPLLHPQADTKPSKEFSQLPAQQLLIPEVKTSHSAVTNLAYAFHSSQPVVSSKIVPVHQTHSSSALQLQSGSNLYYNTHSQPSNLRPLCGSSSLKDSSEKSANNVKFTYHNSKVGFYLQNPVNQELKHLSNGKMNCHLTCEERLSKLVEYL